MSGKDASGLTIGGEPRIDFLPPEVKAGKQAKKTRRSLVVLVVLVVAACAAGYVFATTLAVQSQVMLAAEQAKTQELLAEQAKYSEAGAVSRQLKTAIDARLVGSATEIQWREYLASLQATLPSGMAITGATIDSQSASEIAPFPDVPLQQLRVMTIQMTASSPDLNSVATWLDTLVGIRGFADVWSSPATLEDGLYSVDVRLHINADAFERRFYDNPKSATEPEPAADAPATESEAEEE